MAARARVVVVAAISPAPSSPPTPHDAHSSSSSDVYVHIRGRRDGNNVDNNAVTVAAEVTRVCGWQLRVLVQLKGLVCRMCELRTQLMRRRIGSNKSSSNGIRNSDDKDDNHNHYDNVNDHDHTTHTHNNNNNNKQRNMQRVSITVGMYVCM